MRFLTENEATVLSQRFVEIEDPMASSVDYSAELLFDTIFTLSFSGVPFVSRGRTVVLPRKNSLRLG